MTMNHEYTVIPAPARGEKVRGARTPADRYAATLAQALNAMAAEGWEYVRAETLPSEERSGLTSRTTVWMNVLVFRRALATAEAQPLAATAATAPRTPEALPVSPAAASAAEAEVHAGPTAAEPSDKAPPLDGA